VIEARQKWESRHESAELAKPSPFLQDVLAALPNGRCLDVACGLGANAELMLRSGFEVEAVDWSVTALRRFRDRLRAQQLEAKLVAADVRSFRFPESRYDVILCFRFLERGLWRAMSDALRPDGVVVLETVTTAFLTQKPEFPKEYCLLPGELMRGFAGLEISRYQESPETGLASLVARKA